MTLLERVFPKYANNDYRGSRIASYAFLLIALVGAVRSCIHLLAPDGGAGSIAGMDLSVAGAQGIVFAFSLWGSAQLLYALIQLVVFFRYKTLIPFFYSLLALETLLRMLVGWMKPVAFAHTPPGAFANYLLLPLAILLFILSLPRQESKRNGMHP